MQQSMLMAAASGPAPTAGGCAGSCGPPAKLPGAGAAAVPGRPARGLARAGGLVLPGEVSCQGALSCHACSAKPSPSILAGDATSACTAS